MSRWPWLVAAVATIVTAGSILAWTTLPTPLSDASASPTDLFERTLLVAAGVPGATLIGALLIARVPGNIIGYLLLAAGALGAVTTSTTVIVDLDLSSTSWAIAALSEICYYGNLAIILGTIPFVFPTGRLLGPGWRWTRAFIPAAMLGLAVVVVLRPETFVGSIPNPFTTVPATLAGVLEAFAALLALVAVTTAVCAVVVRFRRSFGVERQQLKWLLAVAAVQAVALPASIVVPSTTLASVLGLLSLAAFVCLPIAIGIAVLRYRLYEIDRLISRTIGWAAVTGLLVGAFALLVLGLTALLEPLTGGNTLAVAGSTLIVALLFTPVRSRVQGSVDRRFDRSRYDGDRTLEAFGERLRDEVDLETIRADVLATVETSVRPTRVGLWLRDRETAPTPSDPVTIPGRSNGSMPS